MQHTNRRSRQMLNITEGPCCNSTGGCPETWNFAEGRYGPQCSSHCPYTPDDAFVSDTPPTFDVKYNENGNSTSAPPSPLMTSSNSVAEVERLSGRGTALTRSLSITPRRKRPSCPCISCSSQAASSRGQAGEEKTFDQLCDELFERQRRVRVSLETLIEETEASLERYAASIREFAQQEKTQDGVWACSACKARETCPYRIRQPWQVLDGSGHAAAFTVCNENL